MKLISFSVSFVVAFIVTHLIMVNDATRPAPEAPAPQSAVQLLRAQHDDLTDWQLLQLAICYTESRFNPDAVGSAGDFGMYQMTDIYIREVNRVAGTDYAHTDAFDPDKAVEIFNTMQQFKNPGRDLELAVYYHNKSPLYLNKVLENLELIRRYEAARKAVTAK